jgi:hypothetical protein
MRICPQTDTEWKHNGEVVSFRVFHIRNYLADFY